MAMLVFREMTEDDLDFAAQCTAAEGWATETREEFEAFLAHDPGGCLLALWDGRRAGICVATCYGSHGFVGELIVSRDLRSVGIGPRLFGAAVEWLRARGCGWISLDGVRRAVPFYESFGFEKVCRSLRLTGRPEARRHPCVRPMEREDLAAVFEIDRHAFGADRSFFLERRFVNHPELARILMEDGRIDGYTFGRRRSSFVWVGPFWARRCVADPGALLGEVAGQAGGLDLSLGVLESNRGAVELSRGLGFVEKPNWSWRMTLRGTPDTIGLDPELIAIGTAAKG